MDSLSKLFNLQSSIPSRAMPPNSHQAASYACQENHQCASDPPHLRTSFGSRPGAVVQGWPSTGGIYVLYCSSAVELDFLHVDRFTSMPRSVDQAEEDAHCTLMRKLGAKWFRSEDEYTRKAILIPDYKPPVLVFGWPERGGVWILKCSELEATERGIGRVGNAVSMAERCEIIERLGGVFYADPKDCPDLDF